MIMIAITIQDDLYMPKRGIGLSEDWKPRLPDVQNTRRGKEGTSNALACQDGHLTQESGGKAMKVEDLF